MQSQKCYLTEEDPPEDHDFQRYSAVCGRCYGALADLERDARNALASAETELTALREQLAAVERERDALLAQMKATGHVPYLERMSELAARAEKAEAANSRLQAELTTLKHAHANHFADVRRVTEWAAGDRSALFSFTDGPERQMAYLVEAERRRVREEWSAVSVK